MLPAYGGVTGWAALRWMGAQWFTGLGPDGTTPVPVVLVTAGDDIRSQPGIEISAERLAPTRLVDHDGLTVTLAVRSVCFEMRYAVSVRAAVVAVDMRCRPTSHRLTRCGVSSLRSRVGPVSLSAGKP